jgi:hypothetical protein
MELNYANIYFSGGDVLSGGVLAGTEHGQTNQLRHVCAVKPGKW